MNIQHQNLTWSFSLRVRKGKSFLINLVRNGKTYWCACVLYVAEFSSSKLNPGFDITEPHKRELSSNKDTSYSDSEKNEHSPPNTAVKWLALLLPIREVPSLILGLESGALLTETVLSCLSSFPPGN
jgi:hypothetical protein